MPVIHLETRLDAPIEMVFDLARSIDLHVESTAQTNEKAVAGRTNGLIGLGEEVTWEATHLGVRRQLTTKIVHFDPPIHFRDSMVSGADVGRGTVRHRRERHATSQPVATNGVSTKKAQASNLGLFS